MGVEGDELTGGTTVEGTEEEWRGFIVGDGGASSDGRRARGGFGRGRTDVRWWVKVKA